MEVGHSYSLLLDALQKHPNLYHSCIPNKRDQNGHWHNFLIICHVCHREAVVSHFLFFFLCSSSTIAFFFPQEASAMLQWVCNIAPFPENLFLLFLSCIQASCPCVLEDKSTQIAQSNQLYLLLSIAIYKFKSSVLVYWSSTDGGFIKGQYNKNKSK